MAIKWRCSVFHSHTTFLTSKIGTSERNLQNNLYWPVIFSITSSEFQHGKGIYRFCFILVSSFVYPFSGVRPDENRPFISGIIAPFTFAFILAWTYGKIEQQWSSHWRWWLCICPRKERICEGWTMDPRSSRPWTPEAVLEEPEAGKRLILHNPSHKTIKWFVFSKNQFTLNGINKCGINPCRINYCGIYYCESTPKTQK